MQQLTNDQLRDTEGGLAPLVWFIIGGISTYSVLALSDSDATQAGINDGNGTDCD